MLMFHTSNCKNCLICIISICTHFIQSNTINFTRLLSEINSNLKKYVMLSFSIVSMTLENQHGNQFAANIVKNIYEEICCFIVLFFIQRKCKNNMTNPNIS